MLNMRNSPCALSRSSIPKRLLQWYPRLSFSMERNPESISRRSMGDPCPSGFQYWSYPHVHAWRRANRSLLPQCKPSAFPKKNTWSSAILWTRTSFGWTRAKEVASSPVWKSTTRCTAWYVYPQWLSLSPSIPMFECTYKPGKLTLV